MDKSIKTLRQRKYVFEPYDIVFKELKKKKEQLLSKCSAKNEKTLKTKTMFGGGGGLIFRRFTLFVVVLKIQLRQKARDECSADETERREAGTKYRCPADRKGVRGPTTLHMLLHFSALSLFADCTN